MTPTIPKLEESRLRQKQTFRWLFCHWTRTPIERYEQAVFRKSLYIHARIFALLILRFRPEIFREDFEVIQELAEVNCPDVFAMEVSRFDGRNKRDRSKLRRLFLIRVSGKRLTRWKARCFSVES